MRTDSLGEGFHYYSLLIDGVAVADPGSETFYGMGRMASGIEVPFKGGEYYALKHGTDRQNTTSFPLVFSFLVSYITLF